MRRKRFNWFPTLGSVTGAEQDHLSGRSFEIAVAANVAATPIITTLILAVTSDAPIDNTDVGNTNALIMGQEWFLERIVGKLFLGNALQDSGSPPTAVNSVLIGAGFFVARANDADSGGGVNTPIGSATVAERNPNYSPLHLDAIREPWLWRRTWVLGGDLSLGAGLSGNPLTNSSYGSVLDGPHIDAKSVRRIGQDERLWFAVSTASLTTNETQTSGVVQGYLDYRILGALRRARGKSAF